MCHCTLCSGVRYSSLSGKPLKPPLTQRACGLDSLYVFWWGSQVLILVQILFVLYGREISICRQASVLPCPEPLRGAYAAYEIRLYPIKAVLTNTPRALF